MKQKSGNMHMEIVFLLEDGPSGVRVLAGGPFSFPAWDFLQES
jgi:hypothetical protein